MNGKVITIVVVIVVLALLALAVIYAPSIMEALLPGHFVPQH